jgi:hypothetical protein
VRERETAARSNFSSNSGCCISTDVVDQDAGAFCGKEMSMSAAKSASRTSYDCNAAVEQHHDSFIPDCTGDA